MKILKNKTAIVTGGSRGIGKAIVLKFAKNGANVVFTYVSSIDKANLVVQECQKYNVKIIKKFQSLLRLEIWMS